MPETTDTSAAPAQPVETPTPADATERLARLSPTDLQTWRETGNLPSAPAEPSPVAADADDDEPVAEPVAAAPAPPAAAAPAKPISKRQQQINDLERSRKAAELRIQELEAQLAQRSPSEPKRETSPAAAYDGTDPSDPAPKPEEFLNADDPYKALLKAELAWETRKAQRVTAFTERQASQRTALTTGLQQLTERGRAFAATHPDHFTKTAQVSAAIQPESVLAKWLMDSPVSASILDHLADHPEDFAKFTQAPSFEAAHAAFIRLETRFEAPPPAAASAGAVPPETSAPAPPTVLTGRGTAPADPVLAALRDKDTGRYLREANAREMAALRKA